MQQRVAGVSAVRLSIEPLSTTTLDETEPTTGGMVDVKGAAAAAAIAMSSSIVPRQVLSTDNNTSGSDEPWKYSTVNIR